MPALTKCHCFDFVIDKPVGLDMPTDCDCNVYGGVRIIIKSECYQKELLAAAKKMGCCKIWISFDDNDYDIECGQHQICIYYKDQLLYKGTLSVFIQTPKINCLCQPVEK